MKIFYLVISVFTHFILTANNTIGHSGKVYAMAAMMPFAMVPIDDVPLLSFALANKTVNTSHKMSASNIEDVSMALMNGDPYTSAEQKQRDDQMVANAGSDWNDTKSLQNAGAETNWISESTIAKKDPYTSDEQRLRDQYQINDTDWYSVGFEEVNGTSSCQLALHQDWITQHGYVVDGIVHMNLPEQGISGPFRVTAIKHILPQKKPESYPGDGYEWKPVTGLFKHHSAQVHNITFDCDGHRNETIGVTATHPVYSTTHHAWRLAGELEVGEQVLTYYGKATVTKTQKREGSEAVYNLEVKDLHNFLVGECGVVVHNTGCWGAFIKLFGKLTKKKVPGKIWVDFAEESGLGLDDISKKEMNQLERLGAHENKRMLHLYKDANKEHFEAIDGLIEDGDKVIPISLKEMDPTSTSTNTLDTRLSQLSEIKAKNDLPKFSGSLENIHAMITAKGFTKSEIANRIKGKRNISEGQRFIKKYFIEGKDGSGWFDGTKWL